MHCLVTKPTETAMGIFAIPMFLYDWYRIGGHRPYVFLAKVTCEEFSFVVIFSVVKFTTNVA